ncbi:unnamed protein product [Medioppia subpectinata]|uniref:U6 snRNA-associated Sm-like protein LSm8 n=1 Tax=Medioppia subpectinata TaxID=1979941 RepID=A0A7R9LBZ9_9ACAR|nr:unnamed protein product [Medioppia subpectinata]CAG2117185.1 unnamed protein product [Medioppia subpectinata]
MSSTLESYVNHTVSVITADGRQIVGTLKGFDQTVNVILDDSHERVYSSSHGVEQVALGLYIVRGDNVSTIWWTYIEVLLKLRFLSPADFLSAIMRDKRIYELIGKSEIWIAWKRPNIRPITPSNYPKMG